MRTLDFGFEQLKNLLLTSGFRSSQILFVDTNDAYITYPEKNSAILVVKPYPSESDGSLRYMEIIKIIDTGNRIRDIIYDQSSNSYFMYQEHTNMPKVVKISKIN